MGAVLHWSTPRTGTRCISDGENLVLIKRDAAQTLRLGSVPFPASRVFATVSSRRCVGRSFWRKHGLPRFPRTGGLGAARRGSSATWSSGYGGLRMYYLSRGSVTTKVEFFGRHAPCKGSGTSEG